MFKRKLQLISACVTSQEYVSLWSPACNRGWTDHIHIHISWLLAYLRPRRFALSHVKIMIHFSHHWFCKSFCFPILRYVNHVPCILPPAYDWHNFCSSIVFVILVSTGWIVRYHWVPGHHTRPLPIWVHFACKMHKNALNITLEKKWKIWVAKPGHFSQLFWAELVEYNCVRCYIYYIHLEIYSYISIWLCILWAQICITAYCQSFKQMARTKITQQKRVFCNIAQFTIKLCKSQQKSFKTKLHIYVYRKEINHIFMNVKNAWNDFPK